MPAFQLPADEARLVKAELHIVAASGSTAGDRGCTQVNMRINNPDGSVADNPVTLIGTTPRVITMYNPCKSYFAYAAGYSPILIQHSTAQNCIAMLKTEWKYRSVADQFATVTRSMEEVSL